MTRDLAERATNRAAFAGMAGALLLSEPGAALGDALSKLPQLARVVESISSIEYERVFLRGAPPYESIFRSDSGQRGGSVSARVVDSYAEIGFTEHESGGWRVAGPDHLGLELRAHAHLVALEAAAWRDERPDEGARMVEIQRRFFADHLVWWAEFALEALREAAGMVRTRISSKKSGHSSPTRSTCCAPRRYSRVRRCGQPITRGDLGPLDWRATCSHRLAAECGCLPAGLPSRLTRSGFRGGQWMDATI